MGNLKAVRFDQIVDVTKKGWVRYKRVAIMNMIRGASYSAGTGAVGALVFLVRHHF